MNTIRNFFPYPYSLFPSRSRQVRNNQKRKQGEAPGWISYAGSGDPKDSDDATLVNSDSGGYGGHRGKDSRIKGRSNRHRMHIQNQNQNHNEARNKGMNLYLDQRFFGDRKFGNDCFGIFPDEMERIRRGRRHESELLRARRNDEMGESGRRERVGHGFSVTNRYARTAEIPSWERGRELEGEMQQDLQRKREAIIQMQEEILLEQEELEDEWRCIERAWEVLEEGRERERGVNGSDTYRAEYWGGRRRRGR